SSIAVLAEYGGKALLLTGGAHPGLAVAPIAAPHEQRGLAGERLHLDALKLSHHGSANATTKEFLDTIDCSHYLVPTDGTLFYHPDRAAIARVLLHGGDRKSTRLN